MPDDKMSVRERYLEQMVESASPEGLLLMMVDGAANFIRRALIELERERFDEVHNHLVKAQNIYIELVISLDLDAGEFAENMALIYQYTYNLLIEANLEKDKGKIELALKLADEIRDIWKEAVGKSRTELAEAAPSVPEHAVVSGRMIVTGVYEPAGESRIVRPAVDTSDSAPRLNITG